MFKWDAAGIIITTHTACWIVSVVAGWFYSSHHFHKGADMQTGKRTTNRIRFSNNRYGVCAAVAVFGFFSMVLVCSCTSPVSVDKEQMSFAAADTEAIALLATLLHPGTIKSITISCMDQNRHTTASSGTIMMLTPFSNHAEVLFEAEFIQPKVKRYHRVWLSNVTWSSSDAVKQDTSNIIRNNWITSRNHLTSYDKTVLNLDSCTIEAGVFDVNADSVTYLLNKISGGSYEYDTSVTDRKPLHVNEITSVSRGLVGGEDCYRIMVGNSTSFRVLFNDEKVVVKSVNMILCISAR